MQLCCRDLSHPVREFYQDPTQKKQGPTVQISVLMAAAQPQLKSANAPEVHTVRAISYLMRLGYVQGKHSKARGVFGGMFALRHRSAPKSSF